MVAFLQLARCGGCGHRLCISMWFSSAYHREPGAESLLENWMTAKRRRYPATVPQNPQNERLMNAFAPLPIDAAIPDLTAGLAQSATAVLVAPPGAGKTTRVPLVLATEPWIGGQKILVL